MPKTDVKCPYCGNTMTLTQVSNYFPTDITCHYCCLRCGAQAPLATSDEKAYELATEIIKEE